MPVGEGGGEAFVIAGQSAEAGSQPAEGAFDDPTFGQENESSFGFVMLDDLRLDRRRLSLFGRSGPRLNAMLFSDIKRAVKSDSSSGP